jgi:protein gp37
MSGASAIEWTDATFNPWWGCQRVSPGCEHCYAETFAKRVGQRVWGVEAPRRFFGDAHWSEPLKWHEAALKRGVRERVFCASMADVFEDRPDLEEPRARLFRTIMATTSLDWQLLTKRPENLRRMLPPEWLVVPQHNVWLMTTAEDRRRLEERIQYLLDVPAVVHGISAEPLLGPVDLRAIPDGICEDCGEGVRIDVFDRSARCGCTTEGAEPIAWEPLDWVIVGSESGPGARPMQIEWARSIVRQCTEANVACFVKQIATPEGRAAGDRKGGDPQHWPSDLRVRQWPEVRK